jgi:hypothetical protein
MSSTRLTFAVSMVALLICAGAAQAAVADGHYAEGVYSDYAEATGNRILFDVTTLESGRLSELAGQRFGDVIQASGYRIETSMINLDFDLPHVVTAQTKSMDHELTATAEDFDKAGYPSRQGQYRLLEIGVGLGTEKTTHQALEFCWPKQGHCVVLDPAVTFLDTMIQNRRRLQAEGFNVKIKLDPVTSKSTCQLASHRGYIGITYTWGGYSVNYKDIFGITLVHKSLGGQQSGLRCDASCHPAPYGYSNSSSCYGNLGYSCACGNAFGSGKTGGTGKSISETKCTHQLFTASQASVSIKNNFTASVSLSWTVNGGVDSNGGSFLDTCGFF